MSLYYPQFANTRKVTAGQHLIFTLGAECYALNLDQLRDIKAWHATGHAPGMPQHQCGALELNGEIIPVYDLNTPFRAAPPAAGETHIVVLASLGERMVGLLIDAVMDLLELHADEITLLPQQDRNGNSSLIHGFVNRERLTIGLLDLAPLVNATPHLVH